MEKPSTPLLSRPSCVRGMNFYRVDTVLNIFLRRTAPELLRRRHPELEAFGAFCGAELDEQAEYSDRIHPPVWKNMPVDAAHPGTRRGRIFFNSRYEDCHSEVYARGFIARAFDRDDQERAPHLYAFIAQYLISQADISIGCPFAMTHPVALVVDRHAPEDIRERFLHESIRDDGKTKSGGTWATEKHSGSDIGGTETTAVRQPDGAVRLYGQKWFASNAGSGLVIATARPEGAPEGSKGLGLYLVPSHVDEDWQTPNDYQVTFLKEKIGTRALATGEIELEGALAYEIAAPPKGLAVMMEALGCSRVHNAMAAAGVMRRALNEALAWACNREVFGKTLIAQPMIRKRVVELAVRWQAGCAMAFEAARSFDKAQENDDDYVWSRIVTALAKYKTAEDALWCAQKALSLVAGNGYTEDYPVARLFRDAMVLPVWEGPEQIQALELMRMIAGGQMGDRIFTETLEGIVAELGAAGLELEKNNLEILVAEMGASLEELRARPEQMAFVADDFLHKMSDLLAYALLCREAAWELKNDNNKSKHLACDYYFKTALTRRNAPSFATHPLLEHFDAFIGGQPIPA